MNARMIMVVAAVAGVMSFSAGQVRADAFETDRVNAHDTETWRYEANNSGWVIVSIEGDGDTDLDLYIRQEDGRYVARNTNYSDQASVEFYAVAGRTYNFEVHNLGDVYNVYEIEIDD
jgi:hypothetical protein